MTMYSLASTAFQPSFSERECDPRQLSVQGGRRAFCPHQSHTGAQQQSGVRDFSIGLATLAPIRLTSESALPATCAQVDESLHTDDKSHVLHVSILIFLDGSSACVLAYVAKCTCGREMACAHYMLGRRRRAATTPRSPAGHRTNRFPQLFALPIVRDWRRVTHTPAVPNTIR